jgi:hypothetical protein
LKTTELADGWRNVVVSPGWMLKLLQFKSADWLVVTLSCEPFCCAVAEPEPTVMPVGFAKQIFIRAAAQQATSKNNHARVAIFPEWTVNFIRFQNW